MNEEVAMAACAGAHPIAGKPDAIPTQPGEGCIDVVEMDREMMQSFSAFFYIAANGGVRGRRFQQFKARLAKRQHGGLDLLMFDGLLVADQDAERRVEATRGGNAAHSNANVIELRRIPGRQPINV